MYEIYDERGIQRPCKLNVAGKYITLIFCPLKTLTTMVEIKNQPSDTPTQNRQTTYRTNTQTRERKKDSGEKVGINIYIS